MRLVLTEKPSVARDLARVLGRFESREGYLEGGGVVVTWAFGHLLELAEPEDYDPELARWRLEDLPIVPPSFALKPVSGARKQLAVLGKLFARADLAEVVNACDAGREGELIFRRICQYLRCGKPVLRLWLSEATPAAVREAWRNLRPGSDFDRLAAAAEARAQADWIVGINATRACTVRHGQLLSVGRVQTPTLTLLVAREREIRDFRPEAYWLVRADFLAAGGEYAGVLAAEGKPLRLKGRAEAEAAARAARRAGRGAVESVERKERSEPPPQFFNLNDLQKEANRRHGLTAQATLDAAQALYEEHKLITYPRTDSRHVTRALAATFPERLAALAACPDYAPLVPEAPQKPGSRYVDDAKVTDHHAILPTAVAPDLSALKPRERLVYDLVARRFLAAFYPPARWEDAAAVTAVGDLKFLSRGRVQIEPGWRAVLPEPAAARGRAEEGEEAPEEAGALPPLREGEEVRISGARAEERQTQPPPRYTEASLLAAMENAGRFLDDRELQEAMRGHGLGTPATRAVIIERLIEVGYVERRGRTLVPTPKGEVLVSLVPEELRSPEMTARWERMLAEIEEGRRRPESFLQGIVELTERVVNHVREQERAETGGARAALGRCPLCGKDVVEQKKSYSCSGWKEGCSFTIWKEIAGKKVTPKQAQSLLEKGRTGVLQGFRSRAGKAFSAALVLKDGRVEFEFPEGGVRAGGGRGGARSGRR